MTMRELERGISEFLSGQNLAELYRVLVHFEQEAITLTDNMILVRGDGARAQMLTDSQQQKFRKMVSDDDFEIPGDYDDRTSDELVREPCDALPCDVSAVHLVYETGSSTGEDYPIGALLLDQQGRPRLSMNFHLDDIEVGPPEKLWQYLNAIVGQTKGLTIRRI